MHGDPAAAAPYWRYQQQDLDCGEMAVADVIGQISGHEPTEDEITAAAANIPSASHPGPIYRPAGKTSNSDLAVLLAHYGVHAAGVHTDTDALAQDLDRGHKVIVGLNDKIMWDEPGNRTQENHFVVVTGIDTKARVVHLNDSGIEAGPRRAGTPCHLRKGVGHQRQLRRRDRVTQTIARRPASARPSVSSSANSRSPPIGSPDAIRVTVSPGISRSIRTR